ncbi:MAG: DnaA ATPase domain-containing protein, partial [Candidatus Dojkabacteria bacterium]
MKITDPKQLWKVSLAQIEIKLDAPAQFKMFFQDTKLLKVEGKLAVIGVPNPYTSEWLKSRYENLIRDTLTYVYGDTLNPMFEVYQREIVQEEFKKDDGSSPLLSMENGVMGSVIELVTKAGLNPKYTMSNYIVGNSNRIGHAAAIAVVDRPGQSYNPLFVYGKTGVGKTHLAQSIGRSVLERNLRAKV